MANDALVMTGVEFLLSMVESRWAARNGDGGKMDPSDRTHKELEKIEQQIAKLQAAGKTRTKHAAARFSSSNDRIEACAARFRPTTAPGKKPNWHGIRSVPTRSITSSASSPTGAKSTATAALAMIPPSSAAWPAFTARKVMVIGHQKARDTKQKVYRNFGMPNPEGYRKALRVMKIAEKFGRPLFTFVDTPGAYPGLGAEERGQAEAIARNLREMARLQVPIICVITGEGGSGGALAIAVADRVLMMENSVYSVISPEGCASIMWRDPTKKELAAEALRITASDLTEMGCIDGMVPEPEGGAHTNHEEAAALLDAALQKHFADLTKMPTHELVASRYNKFRNMAQFFIRH